MKRIFLAGFTGILFLTACENTGSSTVGKYEQEQETTQSSEKSESGSHGEQAKEKMENTTTDTLSTSGDAPQQRSGTEIKTDENASADTTTSPSKP